QEVAALEISESRRAGSGDRAIAVRIELRTVFDPRATLVEGDIPAFPVDDAVVLDDTPSHEVAVLDQDPGRRDVVCFATDDEPPRARRVRRQGPVVPREKPARCQGDVRSAADRVTRSDFELA